MARRIQIYPYRIPSSPSSSSSSWSLGRIVHSLLHRRRTLSLSLFLLLSTSSLYYLHQSLSTSYYYISSLDAPNFLSLSESQPDSYPLEAHNSTHYKLPKRYPLLPSTSPSFSFNPPRPCNAQTLTLSFPPISNSSSRSSIPTPDVIQWFSPSPPLPLNTSLSTRLDSFLNSPLSTSEIHSLYNSQTCSSPSISHNLNKLHYRENVEFWRNGLTEEQVWEIRTQVVRVLQGAQNQGRMDLKEGPRGKRGLVWTAGNADTFDRVLVSLRLLRNLYSCNLPAEIFHFPSESPSPSQLEEFTLLNALVIPLTNLSKSPAGGPTKQFHIKGLSLTSSSFTQLLYLDSDSLPTRSPETLFDSKEFQTFGVVLWNDFWKDSRENGIWRVLGIQCRDELSVESGQVLVDKARHMDALILLEHWLESWKFWFRFSDGDKDLLRYALLLLRKRWSTPSHPLVSASWTNPLELGEEHRDQFVGHTMIQFGLTSEFLDGKGGRERGRPLFVHGNLLKRIVGDFGGNGGTWGRNLQLRIPTIEEIPSLLTSSSSSSVSPVSPAPSVESNSKVIPLNSEEEESSISSCDDFVNMSPFTGLGITHSYSPTPLENNASSIASLRRRIQGLLSRGMRTEFWDGHRGWSYVLGIQTSWKDELEGLELDDDDDDNRRNSTTLPPPKEGIWEEWVRRERVAECSKRESIRDQIVSSIRKNSISGSETIEEEDESREMKPEGERGFMEVVKWEDFEELREFEKNFYEAGGRANGIGF
ncbi:hypothetical protein JCM16303_003433 [Sporobolomyces ruberrimus]